MNDLKACVFLDRDGVIIENKDDYVRSWDDVAFLPGVFPALAELACSQFTIIIITNQSAIGKGLLDIEELEIIHKKLLSVITENGGRIDAIYTCPHQPEDQCNCRKPKPGLLYNAAEEFGIDLKRSILIGDAWGDIQASKTAGCLPILVLSGRGQTQLPLIPPHIRSNLLVFKGLPESIKWLLSGEKD